MLEIGYVAKAHGVRGDVVVKLTTNRTERMAKGETFVTDAGPLTIVSVRSHQQRYIVSFAGIDGRNEADALQGTVLKADAIDDPDEFWVHELIDRVVVDSDGIERGRVTAVLDNPASDLLELDTGHLVPIRFVVSDPDSSVIEVHVPDGLFDLLDDADGQPDKS